MKASISPIRVRTKSATVSSELASDAIACACGTSDKHTSGFDLTGTESQCRGHARLIEVSHKRTIELVRLAMRGALRPKQTAISWTFCKRRLGIPECAFRSGVPSTR